MSAVVVVTLASLVSGCSAYEELRGSSFAKQDPETIVAQAAEAMEDVTTMRVVGQVSSNGSNVVLDVTISSNKKCSGWMRVAQGRMDIRRVGKQAWVKGDSGTFNQLSGSRLPAHEAERLSKLWIPLKDKGVQRFCDLRGVLKSFRVLTRSEGKKKTVGGQLPVTVEEELTLDGVRVVKLAARPGGTHEESLWVRTESPHHVIKVTSSSTTDGGSLSLSMLDELVDVRPPARDELLRR